MKFDTYMLVWSMTVNGKPKSGLFMYDEETVKTFSSIDEASAAKTELAAQLRQFGVNLLVRIVRVV